MQPAGLYWLHAAVVVFSAVAAFAVAADVLPGDGLQGLAQHTVCIRAHVQRA